MYDRKSFPATGKWARHLIRLANVSKTHIDARTRELSKAYSFNASSVPAHLQFAKKELDALQYLLDWNCRAVLLDQKGISFAKHIALVAATLSDAKSVLIYASANENIPDWVKTIEHVVPNEPILVHTDKRFENKTRHSEETASRKWVVTTMKNLTEYELLSQQATDHIIIQRNERTQTFNINAELITGIASEILKTTIIYETTNFWDEKTSYHSQVAIGNISSMIRDQLKLNSHMSLIPTLRGVSGSLDRFYRKSGVIYDLVRILEACGVCFDLVMEKASTNFKNLFSNSMLVESGEHGVRRKEIINRYRDRLNALVQARGKTIDQIISDAVDGDEDDRQLLEQLKSQEWAKLKAQMFYNALNAFKANNDKIIVVTKNENIKKYIMLSLNAIDVDGTNASEQAVKFSNFVYPLSGHDQFDAIPQQFRYRANNIIVTQSLVDLDPRVLGVANHVVIAEYDYNDKIVGDYVELSSLLGFKLYFGTMRGTFEEKLADLVLSPHY